MMWLKKIFGRTEDPSKKVGTSVSGAKSMADVMEKVDAQVGRAVTRLADR